MPSVCFRSLRLVWMTQIFTDEIFPCHPNNRNDTCTSCNENPCHPCLNKRNHLINSFPTCSIFCSSVLPESTGSKKNIRSTKNKTMTFRKIKIHTAVHHIQPKPVLGTQKTDSRTSLQEMPHLLPGNLLWGTTHPLLQNPVICPKQNMLWIPKHRAQTLLYHTHLKGQLFQHTK